jgi:hypothetical protein
MGYPLGVLIIRVPGGPDPSWRTLPLSGELIQCRSDHGDFVCPHGEIAMSGDDRMDSNT